MSPMLMYTIAFSQAAVHLGSITVENYPMLSKGGHTFNTDSLFNFQEVSLHVGSDPEHYGHVW